MFSLFIHLLSRCIIQGGWQFSHFVLCGIFQTWGSDHGINLDKEKVQTKQRHLLRPLPVVLGKLWLHISTKHSSWVAKSLASHSTKEALGLYLFSQWAKTQHKNKENYDQMIRVVICRRRR